MFKVNDILVLEGWTFNTEVLKDNGYKFKVIAITAGTRQGPEGFEVFVEGVVDGARQMFSTITLENGIVTATKVDSENVVMLKTPKRVVEGAKVRTTATGQNPDFTAGKEYTIEEIVDSNGGTYLVVIEDDDEFPCLCLISDSKTCPHAGEWELV